MAFKMMFHMPGNISSSKSTIFCLIIRPFSEACQKQIEIYQVQYFFVCIVTLDAFMNSNNSKEFTPVGLNCNTSACWNCHCEHASTLTLALAQSTASVQPYKSIAVDSDNKTFFKGCHLTKSLENYVGH